MPADRRAIAPPPVRSLLFVPANRGDRMGKALASEADAAVFDLESAIPRGEATVARDLVREMVAGHGVPRPAAFVRVSAVGTDDFAADLLASVHPNLTGILLPQVSGVADVRDAAAALEAAEAAAGVPIGSTVLLPLLETAAAVREAYDIACASPRVAYLGGGVSREGDIARAIGFEWTPEGTETLFLRSKVLVDARAAGIANPITGIWGIVDDLDGLRAFAEQNRRLGYEGMMCIHPAHLPVLHDVFTPSPAEIERWQAVIDAMEEAEREGLGAIRLDGRLIDVAHVKTAHDQLERARRLGVL